MRRPLRVLTVRLHFAQSTQLLSPKTSTAAPRATVVCQPLGASVGFCRLRPFLSVRPVPMHTRQTTHLPSAAGSPPPDHQVQPDPLQVEHRSFSAICRSFSPTPTSSLPANSEAHQGCTWVISRASSCFARVLDGVSRSPWFASEDAACSDADQQRPCIAADRPQPQAIEAGGEPSGRLQACVICSSTACDRHRVAQDLPA